MSDQSNEQIQTNETDIILHISENGDDSNDGSRENPLWSVAKALDKVRWKSYRTAMFVIHGSITEIPAHRAMIEITGKGLPAIYLRGESPEEPGKLNAADLQMRVLYVSDGNTLYLEDNVVLCGGKVNHAGGAGLAVEGGTVIMRGGEISGNDSGFGMGGGVYVCMDSEFIMEGGLITKNTTMMHGGGVFFDNGAVFLMKGGTISKNTAFLAGGGVFVGLDSDFEMTGGSIEGNKSGSEKTMLLNGMPIPLGEGGGVYVNPGTSFRMKGGQIINNRSITVQDKDPAAGSGGGVYVEQEGAFYFEKGSILENGVMNWGGGVYCKGSIITSADSVIGKNIARLGGGGVHLSGNGACFTMKGGFLMNNFTAGNGGGISILAKSSFTMENGLISENEASNMGRSLAIEGTALIHGGLILSSIIEGKNKDKANDTGKNGAKKAKKKKTSDTDIFLGETGKLTLRGGAVDGKIAMKDASQLEDLREPDPPQDTETKPNSPEAAQS
ncbi:MAG: right-handed parallel beta-helix repeat-containing protein [Treponema sp.]|jgi:hypothetical protein|nr:right-handed parallel beta-helix repeat-containing protein [Treponema sp.]